MPSDPAHPLEDLLRVRLAIKKAIETAGGYGYESFNQRLYKLEAEAHELFKLFDEYSR